MVEEPAKKFAVGDMPPSPTTSNPISNTTTSHKKPTRHHVKRRSSGRVHVSKLAPMARAHTPQPTNEDDDNFEDVEQQQQQQQQQQHAPRKPMKRSHSSKSIHRLSSNDPHRKVNLSGFTMTSKSTVPAQPPASSTTHEVAAHDSPPNTPTEQQPQQTQQNNIATADSTCMSQVNTKTHVSATPVPPTKSLSTQKAKPVTSPSFQVSHQSPAAPLAHILNATANTLVTPDKPALANLTTSTATTGATTNDNSNTSSAKSKQLYSRFVQQQQGNGHQESIQDHQSQQQHRHQQQQQLHHHHHKHQQKDQMTPVNSADDLVRANLAIVSDHMDKEYQIIQDYQDPMIASLARCMQQRHQQKQQQRNSKPTSTQLQLHRLAQMGAQQRTFSSSILPTMATLSSQTPSNSSSSSAAQSPSPTAGRFQLGMDGTNCQQHMEHRQMARQRHQRLKAAHLSSTNHYTVSSSSSSSDNNQVAGRWSAGAFLDRMFYGAA